MDIDLRLHDQLARELSRSDAPPIGSLVPDALAAGVRRRRFRRYGVVGSTAAGIVALATVGVFVIGGTSLPTGRQVASGNISPAPTATAGIAAAELSAYTIPLSNPPYRGQTTNGQAVIALMTKLMPFPGHVSEIIDDASAGSAEGSFVYDDGKGAATVSASVANMPADYGPSVPDMQCPPDLSGFTCTTADLPHGSNARIMTIGPASDCTAAKCSIVTIRVEIQRADGIYVIAEASSGPEGHGRGATRETPLLSTTQLVTFATDTRWSLQMKRA